MKPPKNFFYIFHIKISQISKILNIQWIVAIASSMSHNPNCTILLVFICIRTTSSYFLFQSSFIAKSAKQISSLLRKKKFQIFTKQT